MNRSVTRLFVPSGLASVMADGVAFKYLAAPLAQEQLRQLFQIPPPLD